MPEDNPEKKRLVVDVSGPAAEIDHIDERISEVLGDIASEEVSVEVSAQPVGRKISAEPPDRPEPSWVGQNKASYTRGLLREYLADMILPVAPELYRMVENPQTGNSLAVITGANIAAFGAEKVRSDDPGDALKSRYHQFYSRLINYHRRDAREEDNYVIFGGPKPDSNFIPAIGIKVNGSLELLRRLKTGQIGNTKMATRIRGIKGIGPRMTNSFEEYCEELFPGVDICLASQELDLDFMNRLLDRSQRRTRVWAWAIKQSVGLRFKGAGSVSPNRPPTSSPNPYLDNLRALGLIDRRPEESLQPALFYPYEKMQDSRWADLETLMINRGDIPEPS